MEKNIEFWLFVLVAYVVIYYTLDFFVYADKKRQNTCLLICICTLLFSVAFISQYYTQNGIIPTKCEEVYELVMQEEIVESKKQKIPKKINK